MIPQILLSCYELLHGQQDPVFRDKIYEPVGIVLLVSTVVLSFFYYYGLNGVSAKYGRTWPHWGGVLIANAVLNLASVFLICYRAEMPDGLGTATLLLGVINAVYAAVGFFLASLVLKWGSPNARCTPF